jgi:hypothetical protein
MIKLLLSMFTTHKKHQLKSQMLKEKLDFALTQQHETKFSGTAKETNRNGSPPK